MNVSIAAGTKYLANRPLAEVIALAHRHGADGVELGPGHLALPASSAGGQCDQIFRLLADRGLALAGVVLPDLTAGRDDEWPEVVSQLCEAIATVGRCGVHDVSMAAGARDRMSMDAVVRCADRLLAVAEAARVRLHLANRLGSRIEQIEDLRHLLAALRHPALRLRMDVGDLYAAAVNPRDVFAECGGVVGSMVLSDRIGRQEVPLGTGRVNLEGLLVDLAEAHYDGWLVVNLRAGAAGEGGGPGPVEYVRRLLSA